MPEDYLRFVIFYEYARDVDWIRSKFERWAEMSEEERTDQQDYEEFPFAELRAISPTFPEPWLKCRKTPLKQLRSECITPFTQPPFQIMEERDISPEGVEEIEAPHSFTDVFLVRVNWLYSQEKIIDAVKDELRRAHKQSIWRRTKPIFSKGAGAPWSRLRELAAYRFRKAGFSFERARPLISERKAVCKISSGEKAVLPDYASSGYWNDSVNSAKRLINSMFPLPG